MQANSVGGQAAYNQRGQIETAYRVGEVVQARQGSSATAPYFTATVTNVDRESRYNTINGAPMYG